MNTLPLTTLLLASLSSLVVAIAQPHYTPLLERVSVQDEVAPPTAIIDGEWVAVGSKKAHAISRDSHILFHGQPSYRFELNEDDNTLSGYGKETTKGRAELSYAYATAQDVSHLTSEQMKQQVIAKKLYHQGKGQCKPGSTMYYRFSIYVPTTLSSEISTIFAQWHGMPDRTLVQTPEGVIKKISDKEFSDLSDRMIFKKEQGYNTEVRKDANGSILLDKAGRPLIKTDKNPNGWKVEQGGYPPLAFGFSSGYFNIKANSDRKWMSDKDERCNINPDKANIGDVTRTRYKSSTLVYKSPFNTFPKGEWVTFHITIKWSSFNGEKEQITSDGMMDVIMEYAKNNKIVKEHIVNAMKMDIGRNDEAGYYFKFGIYRVGNSTVPVHYNLANYKEGTSPSL